MERKAELRAEMRKLIDLVRLNVREEVREELANRFVQTAYEWLSAPRRVRSKLLDVKGREISEWFGRQALQTPGRGVSLKHCSLLLECPKCSVINYMDPFSFWNFKGKTKCAGCDSIYAVEYSNGQRVNGPNPAQGPHDKLPGYAQTKDYEIDYTTPAKVSPPSYARPPDQKYGPTYVNIRGNLVAAGRLTAADLVGSRPRFIMEQRPYRRA